MDVQVESIDPQDARIRARLFDFLAPYEAYSLFITGNLKNNFTDSHLYIAKRGEHWVGVAGYYELFQSMVPFALDPETTRALVKRITEKHSSIRSLCAVSDVAEPACDVLLQMGYKHTEDPRCALMQLEEPPPQQAFEDLVRLITPADYAAVALLLRYVRNQPLESPLAEEELLMLSLNPYCYGLVVDGEVVSTAQTNGIGISSFQILGVSTQPEFRNKGFARAVCSSLIRKMWDAGARQSILFTGFDNLAALACYKKLGFRVTGKYWVARLTKP
jgi:ribosomal protein S18 acetylase RimI-like enzyme